MLLAHALFDGFLGPDLSGELLDFAIAHEADFMPNTVYASGEAAERPESRISLYFAGEWHQLQRAFAARVDERLEDFVAGAGCSGFRPDSKEIELVANRDGGHFARHIDTLARALEAPSDRVVSAVYYFHREPAGFTGGELVLHALTGEEQKAFEPRHDRLIVFSAIAPHEVRPTCVPGDAFCNARFSINCWLHRARAVPAR